MLFGFAEFLFVSRFPLCPPPRAKSVSRRANCGRAPLQAVMGTTCVYTLNQVYTLYGTTHAPPPHIRALTLRVTDQLNGTILALPSLTHIQPFVIPAVIDTSQGHVPRHLRSLAMAGTGRHGSHWHWPWQHWPSRLALALAMAGAGRACWYWP